MAMTIAVTGKGGCGKTTVAALMVRLLVERAEGPVLAVDADPNLNLNAALGIEVPGTVGDVREEALERSAELTGGMTKAELLEYRTTQALAEAEGFDLLAMGRPEGPGCYCYANNILRACIDRIAGNYRYVVIDCEAGLEHISRRTTRNPDALVALTDPTMRGLETAFRVFDLAAHLETRAQRTYLAMTMVPESGVPEALGQRIAERGLTLAATIPVDEEIRRRDAAGEPLVGVPAGSPSLKAVNFLLGCVVLSQEECDAAVSKDSHASRDG